MPWQPETVEERDCHRRPIPSCRACCLAAALLALAGHLPASAADKLTVLLDWFVNPDHGPLIVAREKGYFRDAGLDVDLVAPADPNDPPKLVAAGKADIAISYQPQLHMQVGQGLPLTRIGTLIATPLNMLVVAGRRAGEDDQGPEGPQGRLLGRRPRGGAARRHAGDGRAEARRRVAGQRQFRLSPALLSGQVDAVIGAYRNFELNQMEIEGQPGPRLLPRGRGRAAL